MFALLKDSSEFLRLVKLAPSSFQLELKLAIKSEFRKHSSETRESHIAFLLAEGRRRLVDLEKYLKMTL
ncbi:hypothetical protein Gasu_57550 isoform 1 [Galdieria sulphuraria]|uniref:Complex 1 LYR protein domain-containing protein n=1 Tax=Galdieria sulphuraria TaxID=130081 RepID=M2WS16_GALSU|nr:hypothetical protein Gasu_57550 isoform 1 [Galdieria sulphuraria]EME26635.1 hypothetical protein isoform 1 [Galdieria sulphuraria]|eukprot:XP_005703155.1 hypothetical protein isoform 1 [Galdieria sulphuraria]